MLTDLRSNYTITLEISPDMTMMGNCIMVELKVFNDFYMSLYTSQSMGTNDKM